MYTCSWHFLAHFSRPKHSSQFSPLLLWRPTDLTSDHQKVQLIIRFSSVQRKLVFLWEKLILIWDSTKQTKDLSGDIIHLATIKLQIHTTTVSEVEWQTEEKEEINSKYAQLPKSNVVPLKSNEAAAFLLLYIKLPPSILTTI